jgi:AcrR family transcriptional regulator
VTTRDLARAAGVSESTVYRHFPDRQALLAGLTLRLGKLMASERPGLQLPDRGLESVDELPRAAAELMRLLDKFPVEARAEALLNADPRQFSPETSQNSARFNELVARAFPDLDDRELAGISGVLRVLLSSQAWLRMREEFGVPGNQAGRVTAWVVDLVLDALRRGERPEVQEPSRRESR